MPMLFQNHKAPPGQMHHHQVTRSGAKQPPPIARPAPRQPLHWRQQPAAHIAAAGGLFGGLQRALGGAQQPSKDPQGTAPQQLPTQQQPQQPQQVPHDPSQPQFPPYQVVRKGIAYDLRLYAVYPVVEMDYVRREEGYLQLGSYQDGANAAGTRFRLTQPVTMSYHPDGRKVMQMMVGAPRQQQQQQQAAADVTSLPEPSDPAVRLGVSGGELVAVMPFEGYITPQAAAAVRQKLVDALQADGLSLAADEAGGFFRVAQYGQVYTLEQRLNELMLRVQV